jgi:hypothetical protein
MLARPVCCDIDTKDLYLYPGSNMTPRRPRLQHLLSKNNTMASCPSRIHHQLASFPASNPRHHVLPNASAFIRGTVLPPNDDVLPTADASPNAWMKPSCRMVFFWQIRLTC